MDAFGAPEFSDYPVSTGGEEGEANIQAGPGYNLVVTQTALPSQKQCTVVQWWTIQLLGSHNLYNLYMYSQLSHTNFFIHQQVWFIE